jgi:hypothetical protein
MKTQTAPPELVKKDDFIVFFRLENSSLVKIPLDYFLKLSPLRIH